MNWNVLRKKNWKTIEKELNKCELICANCHFMIHSKFNNDKTFNDLYVEKGK